MTAISPAFSQAIPKSPDTRTTLRGMPLWVARALWSLIALASLGLFAALLPLVLRLNGYGDWTIESSAPVFGINIYTHAGHTYALVLLGLKYLAVAVFVAVAFYIFWRKSDDWMAILVSIMLFVLPHTFNLGGYTESWALYPYPWNNLLNALDVFFNGIGFVFLFFVFFLFPDGRFVPRWTRWVALLSLVFVAAAWLSEFLHTFIRWNDTISWLAIILTFFGLLVLATWSQIHRYRNYSTPPQQAQTRLVVTSLVITVSLISFLFLISFVGLPFNQLSPLNTSVGALLTFLFGTFSLPLLPLSFGIAMLRDQLWQSERVLNRAFVYGALTAILLLVYVLTIGALSELFRTTDNFLIAAAATGVVALLFHPLRERLQRAINRVLYGQRDEPFRVLNQLGAQLENTITPDAALPLIVETIARTMRVPYVGIELADDNRQTAAAHFGDIRSNVIKLPLRYQQENVGELIVARRAPNEDFSSPDIQLLENLARQAGAVAYTARLNSALQQSRERIINEREQERKRLRRDLHDGLGPTLAGQTLKLDAAMDLLNTQNHETTRAREILEDVKTQTQNTVANIRRIVYELRPPALDDLGLLGALRAHLAQYNGINGLQIAFDAPNELPPLSPAVQVNAYRIVAEAVHNVVKHANATECLVRITSNGDLKLEINDNGIGLPENYRAGIGLNSMRERAQELGGTFQILPNEPKGARVIASLPLSN